jgi:L-glutamine-phosphate cytidylyltransferase
MKAIILAAGRGSRLLPLTESLPKCLLPVTGTTLLGYQLDTLQAAGVSEAVVVTGFLPSLVEAELAKRTGPMLATPFFNPFFQVADNLASCWLVREHMNDAFLLINGDTLFEEALVAKVIAAPASPIRVTINQKSSYDLDDMKVTLSGTKLTAISKTLTAEQTHAESIGMLRFMGEGPKVFRNKLEQLMRTQDGVHAWFLKAIDAIAGSSVVETTAITGHRWAEVDTVSDFEALKANGF